MGYDVGESVVGIPSEISRRGMVATGMGRPCYYRQNQGTAPANALVALMMSMKNALCYKSFGSAGASITKELFLAMFMFAVSSMAS